ncbi:DUF6377 domain-containing protein [Pedobacter sp. AW31-3R]|uniref:DUF6377 domain-containing protein n=1 Tax=Pedobacter sp. AW31-3R TaxID=3445781 RepID=UPI003FA02AD7
MKNIFLSFLFFHLSFAVHGAPQDTIYTRLNEALVKKPYFVRQKEEKIAGLKRILSGNLSLQGEYDCNQLLFQEYRKFRLDSAIRYVERNQQIAGVLKNQELADLAKLQLTTLYSSSGRYRESELILKSIVKDKLAARLLPAYYESYIQFFEHYSTNIYSDVYIQSIERYRDSLLKVLSPSSVAYKINLVQKDFHRQQLRAAQKSLLELSKTVKENDTDYAMIVYLLGRTYELQQNKALEEKYYAYSAIADIRNSIKDNASMQHLALIYYERGHIDQAFQCTRSAIEDAIFCNVKFRTLQMSEIFSIINTAYLNKEAKGKEQLQTYLLMISFLSIFLILAVMYVYKQMRKVSKIKEQLDLSSKKLAELNTDISNTNDQLNERNAQLSESNHVKEEYIAHFFDLCSAYIGKLENYRKSLNKKATEKQLTELFKMLKSTTLVDQELEELYKNFDRIFLNLYPTFVKDFNSLLIKDEQVVPKHGDLLNTELRIFALIRLGITDSVKIAAFLRYSISTIYNYRSQARNKAAVSRNEFEEMVSKIGNIPGKMY